MARLLRSSVLVLACAAGSVLAGDRPHIVFVVAEDEYNAAETLPKFAAEELADRFDATFVVGRDKGSIPGLEALDQADLAVFYVRRREPPEEQMRRVRKYLAAGKPLVALRTASHAFENWKEFDREVLGCRYEGHHGNKSGDNPTLVRVVPEQSGHPILAGLPTGEIAVPSWLYKSRPLAEDCACLMTGRVDDRPVEPVAWVRTAGGRRVFYTMLGHPDDFALPWFRRMLRNAVLWGLGLPGEAWHSLQPRDEAGPVPGTKLLDTDADIASELVAGVDRFCDRQLASAAEATGPRWKLDATSPEAFQASLEPHRRRLASMLGVESVRPQCRGFERIESARASSIVHDAEKYTVYAVRWPVIRGVHGEGLLLEPKPPGRTKAAVVVLPSAGVSPEAAAGLAPGRSAPAKLLAEAGARVVAPVLIDRGSEYSNTVRGAVQTGLTHREFLYRPGFELGRHLIGYEVMKVSAAVEALRAEHPAGEPPPRVGLMGSGDGGQIALYAAAARGDVDAVWTANASGVGLALHEQPIDRNVFGVLRDFGDDGLRLLALPGLVETAGPPAIESFAVAPGGRGAPSSGQIWFDWPRATERQRRRIAAAALPAELRARKAPSEGDFARALGLPELDIPCDGLGLKPADAADRADGGRMARQILEIVDDLSWILEESPYARAEFWAKADPARQNRSVQEWVDATRPYRDYFRREVVGSFEIPKLPPNPRTRRFVDERGYAGYEVVLDVFDDVVAYGILLVPKDLEEGERRPVVVCQHGLEGRPQDVADPRVLHRSYNQYGCRLAERGFIVFAPQNLYIFRDRFRVLQRKLNPLGKTLFSIIVPQHEQILDWLASLPFVDGERIAFYGLSYGGKTAMRVPALVEKYALSICSADFNDWVWKNASTRSPYSYVNTGEYEIFEWDLGSTFNYAEMAGLICPRPFMVERGHYDGVAPDDRVAAEYAKVRLLYNDLKIPDRTEIEFFDGPHTIHGVGTFRFLHRHLNWPSPSEPTPLDE
jgi:dienelactone hydrolase/type 1 glutamine amidotransferase